MVQKVDHAHQDTRMKDLINECHEVVHTASSAATHLIEKGDGTAARNATRACIDAADVASVVARLAARGSPHIREVAKAAGEVFAKTAKFTDVVKDGDSNESLRRTVDACLRAKETCQEVGVNR